MKPYKIDAEGRNVWIDLDCVQSVSDILYDSIRFRTEISLNLAFRDDPLVISLREDISLEGEPDDIYSIEYCRWWSDVGIERMRKRHFDPLVAAWTAK